jgi:periplasmic divalent cation tolerance protein
MAEQSSSDPTERLAVCLTTAADDAEAAAIARALVEERLAACVSRVPVRSTYRWEGEVRDDAETLLVIKVPASLVRRLRERLPEYLAWALSSCGARD